MLVSERRPVLSGDEGLLHVGDLGHEVLEVLLLEVGLQVGLAPPETKNVSLK